jgi:60 kDa SS-A/Ro ribonucleoprotein
VSKFNTKAVDPHKAVNLQGFPAYELGDEAKLVSQVLTTFFSEPKYYKADDADDILKLASAVAAKDPLFVANLAVYARTVFNMRSVSHVLTAVIANLHKAEKKPENGRGLVRRLVASVVNRPDDLTEIVACYIGLFGKPLPQSLKRGIGDVLNRMDEYGLSKYKGNDNTVKMKDLINLCHPKPKNPEQAELFKRCLEGNLKPPVTWEVELSANGNNKETWEKLIDGNRVGYMALLRNLRNIIKADVSDAHFNKVLNKLSDNDEVLKSRQLPFRFLSAAKELENVDGVSSKVFDVLETALEYSIANLPKLAGKTAVVVDVSGSMNCHISRKSRTSCADIAILLGVMISKLAEDTVFLTFDTEVYTHTVYSNSGILSQARAINAHGGGTAIYKPFKHLSDNGTFVDRIILLSDNEANIVSENERGQPVQHEVNNYRSKVNPAVKIHAVDMQGYGTVQFNPNDPLTNYIAGWSDKLLQFIQLWEAGTTDLADTIKTFKWDGKTKEAG